MLRLDRTTNAFEAEDIDELRTDCEYVERFLRAGTLLSTKSKDLNFLRPLDVRLFWKNDRADCDITSY